MGPKSERPAPGERKRPRNFSETGNTEDDGNEQEKKQESPQEEQEDSLHQSSHHSGDLERSEHSSISEMMEARLKKMPSRRTMGHAIYRASATSFANLLPLKASDDDANRVLCAYCTAQRMSVSFSASDQFVDHCTCEHSQRDDHEEDEDKPAISTIYDKCEALRKTVSKYAGFIVNDQGFQILMVMLILLNSLLIGISTFDFIEDNPTAKNAFETLDLAFLIVFTVELVTQFLHHGYYLFFDGWLLFDLIIVVTSWTLESISVLRTLRLRSFRIFRAFRLTTRIRALKRLVLALFEVFPKITAILCMFSLIMYIFGVMCTELFRSIDYSGKFPLDPFMENYDYFGSLDASVFSLFVMVTLDWAKVTRAVTKDVFWAPLIFCTFVTFSSFCLYNLVVAVVCDAVKMVQDQDDVLMVERYYNEKMEARGRVVNLRQKVDKMTKQQNDLLMTVKMMLEQLDLVDEDARGDFEETLNWLQNVGIDAKTSLEFAIKNLDNLDDVSSNSSRTRVADAWEREMQSRYAIIQGEGVEEEQQHKDPPLAAKSIGLGSFEIIENGSKRFEDIVRLDNIVETDKEADNNE